jgi:hypothetical protein
MDVWWIAAFDEKGKGEGINTFLEDEENVYRSYGSVVAGDNRCRNMNKHRKE